MNRVRQLLDAGSPVIAVSFSDRPTWSDWSATVTAGLDIAEVRVDRFPSSRRDEVEDLFTAFAAVPNLCTIRSAAEGGAWRGTEEARLRLFEALIPRADAVDVELSSDGIAADVAAMAHAHGAVLVASHHNFERTPSRELLAELVDEADALGADYLKIATRADTDEELRELAAFTAEYASRGLITMAMGRLGPCSRVTLFALGNRMAFAFLGTPSAPGQLPLEQMQHLLRQIYPAYNERRLVQAEILEAV